ncbi:MAG: mechanosensitive ion channel family protein [Pseudomonadota bacterium]
MNPLRLLCFLLALLVFGTAQAQTPFVSGAPAEPAGEELPPELTVDEIDAWLATRSDGEIRALLRQELYEGAEAETDGQGSSLIADIDNRLSTMAATIGERVTRWADALSNLGDRREQIAARMALAANGLGGMVLAALGLAAAGVGAGLIVALVIGRWRRWLTTADEAGYRERLVRTIVLTALDIVPLVAFVIATGAAGWALRQPLGPLVDWVWIWQSGVSNAWLVILVARRLFAADAPSIRIAPLSDDDAKAVLALIRRTAIIGAAGWTVAGLSPTLGFGFPPAMVAVFLAGTAIAVLLVLAIIRNWGRIKATAAALFDRGSMEAGAVAAAAPILLTAYIVWAYIYWGALWLETGRAHLVGPLGTLVVLLVLPVLDRLGAEIAGWLFARSTKAARLKGVMVRAWRMVLGIAALLVVASLWGFDAIAFALAPDGPLWARAIFEIALTLLIVRILWLFLCEALSIDDRAPRGDAEDPDEEAAEATRRDTLLPLLRNTALVVLVIATIMIILSSAGLNIGPLLASAGIVGIAIGFGAQTLVRDIFSGAFFLIDDAFRVGEYIELDKDLRGEVEGISIRSLRLRHHRGAIVTIPFGELKNVTNHSRDWVIYKMNFRLEPDTDPNKVKKLVKRIGAELMENPEHGPKFIEPLKSQGVFMIDDDSALVIRVKFKSKPRQQFTLRREIYHRLQAAFAAEGIHLARRKVEVVSSSPDPQTVAASAAAAAATSEAEVAPANTDAR